MTTIHSTITSNSTSTITLNSVDPNGDIWVLSGAQLATGGNIGLDIGAGGTSTTVSFQNGASIWNDSAGTDWTAINVQSNTTLNIAEGSTIESGANSPGAAIRVNDGVELDVFNYGAIHAVHAAISVNNNDINHLTNYGIISGETAYSTRSGNSAGAVIDNFGTLQANNLVSGDALSLSNAADNIHNYGTIIGGIALWGGADTLANTGLIYGGGQGIITIWVEGSEGKTINNSGKIVNTGGADSYAMWLGNGGDTVINSGEIVGTVQTAGGNDIFVMLDGGRVSGGVRLDAGDDTATTGEHGAFYDGSIGNDNFIMSGTGHDTIDGGTDVGGTDIDTVDYSARHDAITVKLAGSGIAAVKVDGVVEDHISNIEAVYGGKAADKLTGDTANNIFMGNGGKDSIDGSGGIDTVTYAKESLGVELRLNGSHAATARIGGFLQDSIKNVENITGGGGADKLTGDSHANILHGGSNSDTLSGGGGHDRLYGDGGGLDVFRFNGVVTASSSDTIYGFKTGLMHIELDHKVMSALGTHAGGIGTQFYHAAGATHGADSNDHIVYNDTDGHLYYDSNGSAAGGVTLLAVLDGHPALAASDIFII